MDPLSIVATSFALAKVAYGASLTIYDYIDNVKNADSRLSQLRKEVDALQSGLERISTTFGSDEVAQLFQKTSRNQSSTTKLLVGIWPVMKDCEKTLEKLILVLQGIEDKPGVMRGLVRKPLKALKLNFKSGEIEAFRDQIRTYNSTMGMTLQMVTICLSVSGNKSVETLGQKLFLQLARLEKKIEETKQNQVLEGATLLGSEAIDQERSQHIDEYVHSARQIMSNASAYSESSSGTVVGNIMDNGDHNGTFGSVVGMNDDQRHRVDEWRTLAQVLEDSDEGDENDDLEMFLSKKRLEMAQKNMQAQNYKTAEIQLQQCLANTHFIKALPHHEVVELKVDLARAHEKVGNSIGTQKMLLDLLHMDLSKAQECHLQHTLAVSYLAASELESAQKYASFAMKTRKKLYGQTHELYYETVSLLVDISTAQNREEDAELYRYLISLDINGGASQKSAKSSQSEISSAQQSSSHNLSPTLKMPPAASPQLPPDEAAARKRLANAGYDINDKTRYLEALFWARSNEETAIVRMILDCSPSITARDQDKWTVLIYASFYGFRDLITSYLDQGADLEAHTFDDYTALVAASVKGRVKVAKLLIDRGANIEARTIHNYTALMLASLNGHVNVTKLLLDRGANIDALNSWGSTALIFTAGRGHIDVIKLLVERGADINKKSSFGLTAWDYLDPSLKTQEMIDLYTKLKLRKRSG